MNSIRKYKIGYYSQAMTPHLQKVLLDEGHEIFLWYDKGEMVATSEKEAREKDITGLTTYKGYHPLPHYADPVQAFKDSNVDFVFSDFNGVNPSIAALIRENFKNFILSTPLTDRMEDDRSFGKTIAKALGLKVPPNGIFCDTKEKVLEFLSKQPQSSRFAIKGANFSALPPTKEDAVDFIEKDPYGWFTEKNPKDVGCFLENIIDGIECAFGGYYSSQLKRWLPTFYINREYKGANNGNRGAILTGEVGTTIRSVHFDKLPNFMRNAFLKIEPLLLASGYTGYFDMNSILTNEGCYFLEFTTRVGYPTVEHQIIPAIKGEYGEFLAHLSGIDNTKDPSVKLKNILWVSACLFGYGYGLPNINEMQTYRPVLHYDAKKVENVVKSYAKFGTNLGKVDFDATYKDNKLRAIDWDRFIVASAWKKYDDLNLYELIDHQNGHLEALNFALSEYLSNFSAWGYTYRDDVGLGVKEYRLGDVIKKIDKKYKKSSILHTDKKKINVKNLTHKLYGRLISNSVTYQYSTDIPDEIYDGWELSRCYPNEGKLNRIKWDAETIRDYIGDGKLLLLASYYKTNLVGILVMEREKLGYYIHGIVVLPEYRGNGIAVGMLEGLDVHNMVLSLDCDIGLHKYYTLAGFTLERKSFKGEIRMVKDV